MMLGMPRPNRRGTTASWTQHITMEMFGSRWRDGEADRKDRHVFEMTLCFTHEVKLMLERAGFVDVELHAEYTDAEPTADTQFVVFIARKPAG
jgi:hypothetical protein